MVDLSIIIVNYNTCQLTKDSISSIYHSRTSYKYEIILVDNASADNTVHEVKEQFKDVIIIENDNNLGFSKANNIGIRNSSGRYILLLNSDTELDIDSIEVMVSFMDDNPHVGAAGCKVLLPDGTLDRACKRGIPTPSASLFYFLGLSKVFPQSPTFNQYHLGHLSENELHNIDCLVGAFMMVRKETIEQVGLLDESYFMYGEDIDWCYRIKQAGWGIYYNPETSILHYKGASSRKKPFKIIYEFHRAMYLFHKKHLSKRYSFILNIGVYSGVFIKLGFSLAKNVFCKRR